MFLKRLMTIICSLLLVAGIANAQTSKKTTPAPKDETKIVEKIPTVFVEMTTNKGVVILELDGEKAPNTVGNFVQYVNDKHYDGLIFHRVMKGFMVQGGGFDVEMNQKATRTAVGIESKNGLKNDKGTIAMARASDPNSATSQFFINTVDNDFLNYAEGNEGYTVFGKVITGIEIVDAIEGVKTGAKAGHQDVPNEPIIIEKVIVVKKDDSNKDAKKAAPKKAVAKKDAPPKKDK